jgi:uncharacterized membrane protein
MAGEVFGVDGAIILLLPLLVVLVVVVLVLRGSGSAGRPSKRSPEPASASAADEIAKLAALHAAGALTDDEFSGHKAKLLE